MLNQLKLKFDIISLTETWDKKSSHKELNLCTIEGYQNFYNQTGTSMKSGCGFFVTNTIDFILHKDLDTCLQPKQ